MRTMKLTSVTGGAIKSSRPPEDVRNTEDRFIRFRERQGIERAEHTWIFNSIILFSVVKTCQAAV